MPSPVPLVRHRALVAPPPSTPLINLQKIGLELGALASKTSLQIPTDDKSARSTPSDLDKPLPLEPHEQDRRGSSVYSNGTSISNIIELYENWQGQNRPVDLLPESQGYQEAIAPLLASRFSFSSSSTSMSALPLEDAHGMSSIISPEPKRMRSSEVQALNVLTDEKYQDENRASAQDDRNDTLSPLSIRSVEYHRRLALERLAPPSPQMSPGSRFAISEHNSYLPGPIQGTITDVVAPELVPAPLNFSRTTKSSKPYESTPQTSQDRFITRYEDTQHDTRRDSWSSDSFVIYTGVGEALKAKIKEKWARRKDLHEREKQKAGSTDFRRVSNMEKHSEPEQFSLQEANRSSLSQGLSTLVRVMSLSGRGTNNRVEDARPRRRQKQLAVPLTPYQMYGADIWLAKNKKKRRAERRARHAAMNRDTRIPAAATTEHSLFTKAGEVKNAYRSGQGQIVGAFDEAKQKLTRSSSQKRREKLKKSIKLVGLTEITPEQHSKQEPKHWI